MIQKLLIANRGEIAVRIIRACREMGIESVAVYSEADQESLHTQLADEAVCIGPSASSESYLNMESIISAAMVTGADAIHPGFGFLSENAKFAQLCEQCGITFVGPNSSVIQCLGNKQEARNTMTRAGVPVIPGTDESVLDVETGLKEAERIGYPVIIKAALGGGGKGMRVAYSENEFTKASMNLLPVRRQIEKKRYEIDPFIDNKILKPAEYIKREIEIQENAISKKRMKELIESGASEIEIAALLKSDLSLIAEVYAFPQDEYIVFSEFPLGDKKVDFVIFSGRSTMDVTFIEVKGAEFNLKKRSHYDSLNAKIEEANSQIRNHRKYIYNEYDIVRENLHNIREKAQ